MGEAPTTGWLQQYRRTMAARAIRVQPGSAEMGRRQERSQSADPLNFVAIGYEQGERGI